MAPMSQRRGSDREEPIRATWAGVRVHGVSVAGRETWFHFPDLGLCFDIGRCPTPLVPVPNVFLSHAHLDHAAGIPYWASQRRLSRLARGTVWTEPSTVEAWQRLLAIHGEMEGVPYDVSVEAMPPRCMLKFKHCWRNDNLYGYEIFPLFSPAAGVWILRFL